MLRGRVRRYAATVVFTLSLAGAAIFSSLAGAAEISGQEKRCEGATELTDSFVAGRIGLSVDDLLKLKRARSLSNKDICVMPPDKLSRAVEKSRHPKADRPEEWAALRAMQQASSDGVVKPDGLLTAVRQRQRMLESKTILPMAAGISSSQWTFLGPGNIGGRIRSIVIHPTNTNKMWLGSVSGGIWKSTDGGANWSAVNDFMGNLGVSTMAINPANPNIMYAGTGEGFFNTDAVWGYGVFKSTDGGNTWSQLASTIPSADKSNDNFSWRFVNRLAISNSGVVLAGTRGYYSNTHNGNIFRSADGGATWKSTFSGRVFDIRFDPNNSNNAVANAIDYNSGTGQYSAHILRSTDGGQTWSKVKTFTNSNSRIELAYAKSSSGYIYASRDYNDGELYKSTDGGATWAFVSNPGPYALGGQGWYDNSIWVSPTNANLVIVGGVDLWRSVDGGANWSQISVWWKWPGSAHADHHAIVAHPGYDGISNKTVFFGNDGGIYKTSDVTAVGGADGTSGWVSLNNSLGITQFYGGAGNSGAGKIIGGAQDNGHLMTTGPVTWTRPYGGDGGFAAVDPTNSNYMYGEYVYLSIYRSTNGGNSYDYICSGISEAGSFGCGGTEDALFIAPFILDPNNANTMLAGAASLWRSTNVKTATPVWTAIKPPSPVSQNYISAIAVAEGNSSIIWVGHRNGDVYITTNGTNPSPIWTKVDGTLPDGRYVHRLLIDKDNTSRVFAAFGGYEADNLHLTTNSGTTWTDVSGNIPSAPIRTIVRHPTNANWLYAGTEVGIFTSENGGTTWSTTNDGPANVPVDELFWYSGTELVAVTHGRGMFKTTVTSGVAAPTNLKAVSASASRINLSWKDNSNNETGFRIYRKAGSAAWALLTTAAAGATTYSDLAASGNTSATPYSYFIKACNGGVCSTQTKAASVPYKPTTLNVTAATGQINLTWLDKSSNETGFEVYRKTAACSAAGTWVRIKNTAAGATAFNDTGVTNGQKYSYKVRASFRSAAPYAYGYSSYSNCSEATAL